jgi:VanZ family protein
MREARRHRNRRVGRTCELQAVLILSGSIDGGQRILQCQHMRSPFFHGRFLPWVRRAGAYLFLPALAVVAWGELAPQPPSLPGPWQWDKLDHFTAYFGLALLATLGWGLRRSLVWVLLGVVAIGASLEGIQSLVGRDAEWGDMLANTIGALAGLAVAVAYLAVPRDLRR